MSVSVVILAYNEENYIVNCLKSLQTQTVAPAEIIVVDNNSTDSTARLAQENGATVISEKTPGITPARNAGFELAKSQIIARCDADSRPFNNWIAVIEDSFTRPGVIGVTGTHRFYDLGKIKAPIYDYLFTIVYFGGNFLLLGHQAFYGSNMAISRSVWQKIGKQTCSNDRLVHEDIDLAIHAAPYGKIIYRKDLLVGCSARAIRVSPGTIIERLRKWPRTKFIHTRLKRFLRPGKKDSSTARNIH